MSGADYCTWLEKISRNKWRLTTSITVPTPLGDITATEGFETDLFSKVSNTPYPTYWIASIIHDFMRKSKLWTRRQSDMVFAFLLVEAAFDIRERLVISGMTEKQADKETMKLLRRAALYLLGVSGIVGSAYIGLGRLKAKLFGAKK